MRTSLSSIFSSETLRLGAPPSGTLRAAVVALCIFAIAEISSRAILRPVGRYWEYWDAAAASKFESYRRRAVAGTPPEILIIGDSTGAEDIDPGSMRARLGPSIQSYNLAWPGNYPRALHDCTVPLLSNPEYAVPRIVLVSLIPTGFIGDASVEQFEDVIRSSVYCRHFRGDWTLGDALYLARVMPALPFWFQSRSGVLGAAAPDDGFQGLDGKARSRKDQQPAIDALEKSAPRKLDPARLSMWTDLARVAAHRGFQLIAVVPPRTEPAAGPFEDEYLQRLTGIADVERFSVLDWRRRPFLAERHFFDSAHLNREGAKLLSDDLAKTVLPMISPPTATARARP